jgi:hypothetical protein
LNFEFRDVIHFYAIVPIRVRLVMRSSPMWQLIATHSKRIVHLEQVKLFMLVVRSIYMKLLLTPSETSLPKTLGCAISGYKAVLVIDACAGN